MLNDALWLNDKVKMDRALEFAKSEFGENLPYVIKNKLNGSVIVFTQRFVDLLVVALSTDQISDMTPDERQVLNDFIDYENGSLSRDITVRASGVPEALDQVLLNLVYNVTNELI